MLALAKSSALPDPDSSAHVREVPHNIEVEQALLGAILVNNEAFFRIADFLLPAHFHDPIHHKIFDVAGQLIRSSKVATPITLRTFLTDQVEDFDIGRYLALLAAEATAIINTEDYGLTIYELALRRKLIELGHDIVNDAFESSVEESVRKQIEAAEAKLYTLAETGRTDGGFQSFENALALSVDMASRAYERAGGLSGLPTGLTDLDQRMGGLQSSDLIVLAGRPAMGKTALGTNIAYNLAKSWRGEENERGEMTTVEGGIVGFFSLEMSAEQLATRILSEQVRIPSSSIRRGKIDDRDFDKIAEVVGEMRRMPLYIDDTGGLNIAQITSRARRLKRQKGLDVMIVDYLQLLAGSGKRASESRVQEVTEITTGLKALAKELKIPIIALSQLSRQVESRDDKRPQLSDLRESGSIEQDADVVLFVYREEYYLENREPDPGTDEHSKWRDKMELVHGRGEVLVSKQRHGPTGAVHLHFEAAFTRFSDLAKEDTLPDHH